MVTWAHMHSYTSTDIHRHPTFQKSWCTTSHFTDRRYSFVCFYTFLCKGGLGILESPRFLSLFCQEYIFYMDVVSTTNCGVNDLLSWTWMQYENCFAVFKGNAGVRVQIIDNWTTDSDGSFFKFFINFLLSIEMVYASASVSLPYKLTVEGLCWEGQGY